MRDVELDADDRVLGRRCFHRRADAAHESAAADGHDERLDVRHLFEDLERDGSGARDDVRVVVGRHESGAGVARVRLRENLGMIVVAALGAQLGAVTADRGQLRVRRVARRVHDER